RYRRPLFTSRSRVRHFLLWMNESLSSDICILSRQAWAQTSAAGDGRLNGDHSVWKRNFRSALRAKGFKMIFDKKNDAANPHKVYQFPSGPHSAGRKHYICGFHEVWNPDQLYLGLEDQGLFQETSPCPESQYTELHYQIMDTQAPFSSPEGGVGVLGQISPPEGATAAYQPDGECVGHQGSIPMPKLGRWIPRFSHRYSHQLLTFFRIKVYYKGKMVKEQLVENDTGFRLTYQGNIADLPVVRLPIVLPEVIVDQIQAKHTNEILNNLGGLEIRRLDGVVWGHRWGLSRIYWGLCKHENSQTTRELSKNTPEAIYFFKEYISGLMEFMQTSRESPSCTLYLFLGEKWPDPKMKPWEKKLIMIEVILTSLEDLKTMAVANGASSLESVELQLSLEQMMELC
uniref:Interferon regulatory factor 3-like n=1 Tax=Sinocyclocheilus rhinocerous TaxID=307959 RepID=A0A673M219_9TELE